MKTVMYQVLQSLLAGFVVTIQGAILFTGLMVLVISLEMLVATRMSSLGMTLLLVQLLTCTSMWLTVRSMTKVLSGKLTQWNCLSWSLGLVLSITAWMLLMGTWK